MKNLILEGFMGCGKSHIGKRLSEITGMPFLDTDAEIEKTAGMCISDIFAGQGEESFRKMESDELRTLNEKADGMIISLGGGTPCRKENRDLLKTLGVTVYLKASEQLLESRLSGETGGRPMLEGGDLQGRIRKLLAEREGDYMDAADEVVLLDGTDVESACSKIADIMEGMKK